MRRQLKAALFYIARIKVLGALVGIVFERANFLLPIARRSENSFAICFRHPVPMRAFHLLAIPKRRLRTLIDLVAPSNEQLLDGVLLSIESALIDEVGDFWIISNFGRRQEVMQVHFHVFGSGYRVIQLDRNSRPLWTRSTEEIQKTFRKADSRGELDVEIEPFPGRKSEQRRCLIMAIRSAVNTEQQLLTEGRGFSLLVKLTKSVSESLVWPNHFHFSIDL